MQLILSVISIALKKIGIEMAGFSNEIIFVSVWKMKLGSVKLKPSAAHSEVLSGTILFFNS